MLSLYLPSGLPNPLSKIQADARVEVERRWHALQAGWEAIPALFKKTASRIAAIPTTS
jgi:hypothetical protein